MVHRSSFYYVGVLSLVILGAYGCSQSASKGSQGAGGGQQLRQSLSVETATVQRISIERHVELSGTLVSPDQARVSSEVAGVVRDVLIEIGQEVSAGQELVRLDTTETRVKITEAAYQAAVENVQSLRASLQDRQASYDMAKKKLNDAVIRAPLAGSIAERTVQRGEYIRENTIVVTIVRMNPLKLKTAVQEKFANMIHQNQTVDFKVEPFPDDMFHGKIAYISPAIDQGTRTFAAEILVDNPTHRLKPGFFAKGQILVGRDENVLAIPEQTISTLAGVSSVYLIENGVVKQQSVQLGEHEDKFF